MSNRMINDEQRRSTIQGKREQEIEERKKLDNLERDRNLKEAARLQREEVEKRKLGKISNQRELEMQRKLKEEEDKITKQNEEKQRIQETELIKKNEEANKRAEERSKRIEEERKKRQEEFNRENAKKNVSSQVVEIIQAGPIESQTFISNDRLEAQQIPDYIDLLGGTVEGDWEPRRNNTRSQQKPGQQITYDDDSNSEDETRSTNSNAQHRLSPQRGKIDELTDNILDTISGLEVPVKKQGKNDGIYIFGQRIMRLTINRNNGVPHVFINQNTSMEIEDFLQKFMKVEKTRLKGLQSAILMSRMMGNNIPV